MNTFINTIITIITINIIVQLLWLATNEITQRTTASISIDLGFNIVLLIWAIITVRE